MKGIPIALCLSLVLNQSGFARECPDFSKVPERYQVVQCESLWANNCVHAGISTYNIGFVRTHCTRNGYSYYVMFYPCKVIDGWCQMDKSEPMQPLPFF